MPTYTYYCPKCHTYMEMVRKISEHTAARPVCVADGCDGQQVMETVIQAVPTVFKGSGWTPKYGK